MDAVGIFLTGWFFGFALGISIMSLRKTSKDLEEAKRELAELERQERESHNRYDFINYRDNMTDKEFEEFLFGGRK